jgi:hypothetical protein
MPFPVLILARVVILDFSAVDLALWHIDNALCKRTEVLKSGLFGFAHEV